MNFQIGKYVTHPSTGRPNIIKQVRISKGVTWLGFGSNTIGWVKAEDCEVWSGPKVLGVRCE